MAHVHTSTANKLPPSGLLRLPVKVRLEVIRYLLNTKQKVWTSILRVCRSIKEEAFEVLYNENVITIRFEAVHDAVCTVCGPQRRCSHNGLSERAVIHNMPPSNQCFVVPEGMDKYPEFLRRIFHLKIHLVHSNMNVPRSLKSLKCSLHTLSSFLMEGHKVKTLHLELDVTTPRGLTPAGSTLVTRDRTFDLRTLLHPLRRLRGIAKLTTSDNIPAHIHRKLLSDFQLDEPAINTMQVWNAFHSEVKDAISIPDRYCLRGDCQITLCEDWILQMLQNIFVDHNGGDATGPEQAFRSLFDMLRVKLQRSGVLERKDPRAKRRRPRTHCIKKISEGLETAGMLYIEDVDLDADWLPSR